MKWNFPLFNVCFCAILVKSLGEQLYYIVIIVTQLCHFASLSLCNLAFAAVLCIHMCQPVYQFYSQITPKVCVFILFHTVITYNKTFVKHSMSASICTSLITLNWQRAMIVKTPMKKFWQQTDLLHRCCSPAMLDYTTYCFEI